MHCTSCGHYLTTIRSGGCGGNGGLKGCKQCDTLFRMEGGGICTGSHLVPQHGSFADAFFQSAQDNKPHLVEWGDERGQWVWSEPGYAESHYFPTEQEAIRSHAVFIKKLHDELPWPSCDKCGVKPARPYGMPGGGYFLCKPCKRYWSRQTKKWVNSEGE